MHLTDMQKAVVEARGSAVLVAASAGTGKTEALARRCVRLLLYRSHPTSIDRFLVVTFTRAAAAELRERIGRMLRAEAERSNSADLRAFVRTQEMLLDAAQIGTIDAWCQRLVRGEFATAQVDPCFRVLEPAEANRLRREVREQLLEWVYSSSEPLAVAGRDWIESQYRPLDDELSGAIERVNRYREHLVNPDAWAAAVIARTSAADREIEADAKRTLAGALIGEIDSQLAGLADLEGDESLRRRYAEQLREWRGALADGGDLARVVGAMAKYRLVAGGGAAARQIRDVWLKKRLQYSWKLDFVTRLLESPVHSAKLVRTVFRLEEIYEKRLRETKRQKAAYEFADIQRLALNLLTTIDDRGLRPSDIALQQRAKLDHILIDESQDTNAVQLALFRAIGRAGASNTGGELGNCFFVGDIKQSIYGFRRAEPALFGGMAHDFRAGARPGAVLPLADNFRSHGNVLGPLNSLFRMLFDAGFGGSEYGPGEMLRAQRNELPNPSLDRDARVHVTLILKPDEKAQTFDGDEEEEEDDTLALEQIEREAFVAAAEIRRLMERGTYVWARQPDGSACLRALELSDIAILLRTARGKAALAARALRRAGIAAIASGRESLLDGPEAQDLLNALRLIVNSRREVPMAAYLRGPYVGLSDAALLKVRQDQPYGDFLEAVEKYAQRGGDEPARLLRDGLEQLEGWRRLARTLSLPALLGTILNDTGAECFALSRPAGEQRVRALRAFCDLANGFASRGLGEFVSYLDNVEEEDESPAPAPEAAGSVRVMTIHAAKGLEFPVVFLLACGAMFNRESARQALQLHDELGAGLRYPCRPARKIWIDPRHPLIVRAAARREREEELRLLYVACTRARDRLHLIGHPKRQDAWDLAQSQYENTGRLPPVTRENAMSLLDWLLPAVVASQAHLAAVGRPPAVGVQVVAAEEIQSLRSPVVLKQPEPPSRTEDRDWAQQVIERLKTTAAAPATSPPAVLSVSSLKALLDEQNAAPVRSFGPSGSDVSLELPAFVEAREESGRKRGTAVHRFLQFANLATLDTPLEIPSEIQRGLNEGWLTREDATALNLEQLQWLGNSEVGRWLAGHTSRLRKEVDFVFGQPLATGNAATIVRGTIDVLALCEDGLHLFDYKTDVFASAAVRTERLRAYSTQLRLYAMAAGAIANVRVARAALILLSERKVVEVPVQALDLGTIWRDRGAVQAVG